MTSTKNWSKESIKEYAIIVAGVLLILSMVLYTCIAASPNQEKTQEDPLSMIDELEKSFTDTKSNVVYKNRQFEDGGSKEAEKEVDPSVQVEQLENATNMRGTSAPLEAFMLDKYSNFSSTKEKKREMCDKMNEVQHAVEISEKEYRKKADILGKMNASVESFYNIFLMEKKNLTDIKKKYNESNNAYILFREKEDTIRKEIKTYYDNPKNSTAQLPPDAKAKHNRQITRINVLTAKISKLKKDQKNNKEMYIEALKYEKELKNNIYRSRDDLKNYYLHRVKIEEIISAQLDSISKIFRKINNQEKLLYSIKRKEIKYLKNNEKKINPLKEIMKLHRIRFQYLKKSFSLLNVMRDIQKDAIYTAVQLCSAYKKYKAAESEYEMQKKDIDIDLEVLFEEKEELKGYNPNSQIST